MPLHWRYPEWWAVGICTVAWAVLAFRGLAGGAHPHTRVSTPLISFAFDWSLMVAAMMLPLVVPQLREVASASLWTRRDRAMVLFLCGYFAIWIVAGLAIRAMQGGTAPLASVPDRAIGTALILAVALVWPFMSVARRALRECARPALLAPKGLIADWQCVRHGLSIGSWCVVACGPWMLIAAAAHWFSVMIAVTFVLWLQRFRPRHPQGRNQAVLISSMRQPEARARVRKYAV